MIVYFYLCYDAATDELLYSGTAEDLVRRGISASKNSLECLLIKNRKRREAGEKIRHIWTRQRLTVDEARDLGSAAPPRKKIPPPKISLDEAVRLATLANLDYGEWETQRRLSENARLRRQRGCL